MIKAHEIKILDPVVDPVEVTIDLGEVDVRLSPQVYNKLVQSIMQEMRDNALASIEWQLSDDIPVLCVSFPGLELLRFPLADLLTIGWEESRGIVIESIWARDGLAQMFELVARELRAQDDEYFSQFYDEETGRSGDDKP